MEWMVIGLAGLLGGMLNAVAGGGSFLTLPALIFVGVPPIAANATGTAALLPGYLASAWRFRKDIEYPAGLGPIAVTAIAILGGSVGATLLLFTNEQLFSALIPWLILFATAAFMVGPRLIQHQRSPTQEHANPSHSCTKTRTLATGLIMLMVCIYGGYFNGGLGIIVLAALGLMGQTNLHGMNGVKNVISAVLTVVAVIVYASGGAIAGKYLVWMGAMAIVGGYVGAALAYRVPQTVMRGLIVVVGLAMAVAFFLR